MKFVKSFLNVLSNVGVDHNTSRMNQKEIILSNKISLLLLPLAIIGIAMSYFGGVYFTTIGFSLFILFLICVFPLNKFGKSIIARFGLSVLPQLFLLLPNVISGIEKVENYLAFSYIFIGLTIIPLLLFHDKKDRNILAIALIINLLVILFYDLLLVWSEKSEIDIRLIEDNYAYYKLPQIILWVLMVSAFHFLKKENSQYEEKLEESNNSLVEVKNEIKAWNEEIIAQNDSLHEKQFKIEEQNHKLENSNNELNKTKLELLNIIEKLEKAREKLNQKEAEAKSILNALNGHYLIARYDLRGNLISFNTKAIELFGVVRNELFKNIKPIINQTKSKDDEKHKGQYFNYIWKRIINGESQTIKLDFIIGSKTKYLATTFAPLFDSNGKPHEILAIGEDITELVEKNEKIDTINEELKEKISDISQQNELLNFQQKEIFEKSEELKGQNELLNFQQKEIYEKSEELILQKEEIQSMNESLELRVQERTNVLEEKNRQLTEYAFINSHILRSPVSTIMGLVNLISYSTLPEEDQKIYEHLKETSQLLDTVVIKINNAIENRAHFDREFFNDEP